MLLSAPRREGFWDSLCSRKVAQWITIIEEEDGWRCVPEDTMIRLLSVIADLQKRRVEVTCSKPEKGLLGI
jgi:hypothetical protein